MAQRRAPLKQRPVVQQRVARWQLQMVQQTLQL